MCSTESVNYRLLTISLQGDSCGNFGLSAFCVFRNNFQLSIPKLDNCEKNNPWVFRLWHKMLMKVDLSTYAIEESDTKDSDSDGWKKICFFFPFWVVLPAFSTNSLIKSKDFNNDVFFPKLKSLGFTWETAISLIAPRWLGDSSRITM